MSQSLASKRGASIIEVGSPTRGLSAAAHGGTDVGRVRRSNEDCFAVLLHAGLFMVADGMGGAAAGEVAASMLIEQVQRSVEDGETTWPSEMPVSGPESGPRRFLAGIQRANRRIHTLAHGDRPKRGMGTTFAGVLLLDRCAVIAHVGDSRVYRLRGGALELLTRDHSLVNEYVQMGILRPDQAATFPRRHVIMRAVGVEETVDVDTKIVDLRPGDAFLICSDGLHGELDDDAIAGILVALPDPTAAVERLIERANEEGGGDNVTAVVVRVDEA